MASIKKRGTRWFARFRDDTGREHAQRFDRKVDAQRWLDEQTAALVTGQYADPRAGRVVFRQYAEQWRSTMVHGPSTRNLVERTLRCHIYPALGDLPMGSIRTTTVQALVTELSGRLAASTLKLAYGYMVAVCRAAVRDRIIACSPCEGVRLPPPRRKQVKIPPLEVLDILAANLPPRFAVVPELVAVPGCARASCSDWRSTRSPSWVLGRWMCASNSCVCRPIRRTLVRSRLRNQCGWCRWRR